MDFRPHCGISEEFAAVLDELLEPDAARRLGSVAAVREALRKADQAAGRRKQSAPEREAAPVDAKAARVRWWSRYGVVVLVVLFLIPFDLYFRFLTGDSDSSSAAAEKPAPIGEADLGQAQDRTAYRFVPSGPLWDLTRFDPVAALPALTRAARVWDPAARLTRIHVRRLRPDGTADVSGEERAVEYVFGVPAGTGNDGKSLSFEVARTAIAVMSYPGLAAEIWLLEQPCSLRDAVANLRRAATLPERPYYEATLGVLDGPPEAPADQRTGWFLTAASTDRSLYPFARADDCVAVDSQGSPIPADPGWDVPVERQGKVVAVEGRASLAVGDSCGVTVDHTWTTEASCIVRFSCGGTEILESQLDCTTRDRTVVGAKDEAGTWQDGSPALELDLAAGRVVLSETDPEIYRVTVSLE